MARSPELEAFYLEVIEKGITGEYLHTPFYSKYESSAGCTVLTVTRTEGTTDVDLTVGVIVKAFARLRRGEITGLNPMRRVLYLNAFSLQDIRMLSVHDCQKIFMIGLFQEVFSTE